MNEYAGLPPEEPLLDVDDIQGNVLPGFMKPNMRLISLAFGVDVGKAREFLASLTITSLAEVMDSRRKVRRLRGLQPTLRQLGSTPEDVDDVWVNVAISYRGLLAIGKRETRRGPLAEPGGEPATSVLEAQVGKFTDVGFTSGLARRSAGLGDPTDPQSQGHPSNWTVGGPHNEADVLLIVAADSAVRMNSVADQLSEQAGTYGVEVLHSDAGAKFDANGSEHFGFQDGVSQPGVRGRVAEHEFLSHRQVDSEPDRWLYGLPGQFLVWPGEFVFGYPSASADPLIPGEVRNEGPAWSRNGSYLVYRRLHQDVAGFEKFVADHGRALRSQPGFEDWDDDRVGAALVGRWKSGAPLVRSPKQDNAALGRDRLANNLFGYAKAAEPLKLVDDQTTAGHYPEAVADPIGLVCPQAAHIRKVNTRQAPNDMGASRASLDRRILRRGLPFGMTLTDDPSSDDRGLLFVSYQTSIERQFEFLNNRWMGSHANPRSPGGHDLVVGQNGQPGEDRVRRCIVFGDAADPHLTPPTAEIVATTDFVTPTGGGYYFSPSVSALRDVLGER